MYDDKYSKIIKRFYDLVMKDKEFSTNLTSYQGSKILPMLSIITKYLISFNVEKPNPQEVAESVNIEDL